MAQAAADTTRGWASAGSIGDVNRRMGPAYSPGAHIPQRGPGEFGDPRIQLIQLLHMFGLFGPQNPRMPQPQPRPSTPPPGGLTPQALQMLMGRMGAGTDSIPHFQYGGVVTRPTVGLLGEAGPEAVVPLSAGGSASPFGSSAPPPSGMPQSGGSSSPWGGGGGRPIGGGFAGGGAGQAYLQRQAPGGHGGGFDPNNPFAGNYNRPLNTTEDIMGYLLRQNAIGGGFGAQGDPRITQMLRSQALQDATAQGRSARLGLLGRSSVDPSTFGFQSLMSDLNSQGQTANAMNQAQLQQALSAQDWYRNLFSGSAMGQAGLQRQQQLAAQQEAYAKDARRKNILGQIGSLGGAALGAFTGGGGGGGAGLDTQMQGSLVDAGNWQPDYRSPWG